MDTQQLHRSDAPGFMPGHLYPMTILTARDRDVIGLVLAGHTTIYDKLGVSTRLQLAVLLLRDGMEFTRRGGL